MPRYKLIDSRPRLLPVDLSAQLIPGTFEQALDILIDQDWISRRSMPPMTTIPVAPAPMRPRCC